MPWWENNRLRLIQNNLREIDANLDVGRLMEDLKAFSANVLMMNAGGIIAFYPTELEYHYRAPAQTKDLLQEAITQAHANDMKFIARFDFSKAHESLYAKKPEWFYHNREGQPVNYHGIMHTCLNGEYQRSYSLKIIDEVLTRYDVDGIFFNMFGYQNWDYSGKHYGICFCSNCKARFQEMFGMELPLIEDPDDTVYRAYKEFQQVTTREMLDRIHELVQSKNRDIAISTYHPHKVDIIRKESNTAIHRPHPVWQYSASENVKSVEDSWDDKLVSNCCINAIDLLYRFTGVSRNEVKIRLYESLASGSGLDFCIIGVFEGYPDRENFADTAEIFRFHKEHEERFGQLQSVAEIALIKPESLFVRDSAEYLGLFKMLKEAHLPFDVVVQSQVAERLGPDCGYKIVIVPDMAEPETNVLQTLKTLNDRGVHLIATGTSFAGHETQRAWANDVFGASVVEVKEATRAVSAYLETTDKSVFKRFPDRDWIIVDGEFICVELEEGAASPMTYIRQATFGPPERAAGHSQSEFPGAWIRERAGAGQAAYFPWAVGEHYYKYGYEDHKNAVLDILDAISGGSHSLSTNAPASVEIFFNRLNDGEYMLQLLNLSGFNGVTYHDPLPVRGIEITLPGLSGCRSALNLVEDQEVGCTSDGKGTVILIDELYDYAAVVIKTKD